MQNFPNLLMLYAACLLGIFTANAEAAASNTTAFKTGKTENIIVTAKTEQDPADVLATAHILTQADIRAAHAQDLPDLLDQISGLQITPTGGRGSVTGVFVRGTSIAQNIVLIDGVRVGSAALGQAALNSYPLDAIERIEVIKGPLAAIYGADAVGGVIHLFTNKSIDGLGSTTVTVGSDKLLEYGISFGFGNDQNRIAVSAHAAETDGIDHTSILSGNNDDLDGYQETSLSLSASSHFSDKNTLNLSILYTDNESEFDNTFGADTGFVTDTRTLNLALGLVSQVHDSLRWTTTLGANQDESTTAAFFSEITSKRESLASEFAVKISAASQLTIGADYYREDIETLDEFPVTDRDNAGVFALLQSEHGKFSVLASLRFDDNSAYGDETNGSIALNYDFADDLRVVLSYGTAFAAPSFNFLYFPFFGNPDLLAEESESLEISLMGRNRDIDWRASAYRTEVENLFSFDPGTFLAANIGAAELQGLEFEATTQLSAWLLYANLDLLSAKDANSGMKLDDRAERSFNIGASRDFGQLNLSFDLRAEDGRHDIGGTELSGYGLFDLGGAYQYDESLSVSAKITNLFDKEYKLNLLDLSNFYNTPGRQAKLTVRYQF